MYFLQAIKIRLLQWQSFLAGTVFRVSLHFNVPSNVFVNLFAKYRRYLLIIASMLGGIQFLSTCVDREPLKTENPGTAPKNNLFAGSASCESCHADIYQKHLKTAHFLTSQPGEEKYFAGTFEPGKNEFAFNESVSVSMQKKDDGFYQVEYFRDEEKRAERMDIVVGSGTMGQSFLYWRDHHLFQMPITWFSAANQWSNSPGFPDKVVFNRVITSRCLECHTTYAKPISEPGKESEQFDKNNIVYGVDCERCHGPAVDHVKFHNENQQDTVAKFIINPATFTRQQKLDLCALCHGGRLQKTQPSFSFTSGDALKDFFKLDTTTPDPRRIDVHGNQYGLMRASKCFKGSEIMTCNSCHDVHENEKGKTALFSQRCMSCHQQDHAGFCPMAKTLGKKITENCIDCHMPVNPSRAIAVFLPGKPFPTAALIRSHYIAVYPEETARKIKEWQIKNGQ
jgi:hypothetical protein